MAIDINHMVEVPSPPEKILVGMWRLHKKPNCKKVGTLCTPQLKNVIADGDGLIEVADLASFLPCDVEDVVQGSKGSDSPQDTGMSCIE